MPNDEKTSKLCTLIPHTFLHTMCEKLEELKKRKTNFLAFVLPVQIKFKVCPVANFTNQLGKFPQKSLMMAEN